MKKLLPILLLPVLASASSQPQESYLQLYLAEKAKQQYYQKQLEVLKTIDYTNATQELYETKEHNVPFQDGVIGIEHFNLLSSRYQYLSNAFPTLKAEISKTNKENEKSGEEVSRLTTTINNLSSYINNEVDHVNSSVEYYRYQYPVRPTVIENIHTSIRYEEGGLKPILSRVGSFFDSIWLQRVSINGTPVSAINFTRFGE